MPHGLQASKNHGDTALASCLTAPRGATGTRPIRHQGKEETASPQTFGFFRVAPSTWVQHPAPELAASDRPSGASAGAPAPRGLTGADLPCTPCPGRGALPVRQPRPLAFAAPGHDQPSSTTPPGAPLRDPLTQKRLFLQHRSLRGPGAMPPLAPRGPELGRGRGGGRAAAARRHRSNEPQTNQAAQSTHLKPSKSRTTANPAQT